MTCELVKQLKDAGFPQDRRNGSAVSIDIQGELQEFVYDPTLSELIEACGDRFYSLVRKKSGGTYYASDGGEWILPSETPEEAVAKLWLALNKTTPAS